MKTHTITRFADQLGMTICTDGRFCGSVCMPVNVNRVNMLSKAQWANITIEHMWTNANKMFVVACNKSIE